MHGFLTLYDYRRAVELYKADEPFYALVGAAMMRADTENAGRLRAAFPGTWNLLQGRYDAPGGVAASDPS